ncbi:Alpha-1-acid glycoprotein, partial [Galemys pyrenaicus]
MALPWALAVLSLLPLLSAQSPECANFTARPVTNATLDWLSGKWFYVSSILRKPEFSQSARMILSAFFYFAPNLTEDKIYIREYQTIGDRCVYNYSHLSVHRKNGTLSKTGEGQREDRRLSSPENGTEFFAYLLLSKNARSFMLYFFPEDKQNFGLSIYGRYPSSSYTTWAEKPQLSQEQMSEFHEVMACMGMHESEILRTDWEK